MKGIFITIEGPDGSGKTTATQHLVQELQARGYKVLFTREPGGNKIAEQIRDVLHSRSNTEMDKRTEALLYAAQRRQHLIETIIPALKDGYIVISDRYIDSSLAYQGYARGIGIDEVLQVNLFATEGLLPNYTIYFDVSAEEGLARIQKNPNREVNRLDAEKLEFHQKVHQGYLELLKKYPERIKKIDASKDEAQVYQELKQVVFDILGIK
ncbi:MAG: dTMP kinase [Bacilli bacterium]|jgi:dTMP kinase|nr:dTMP kinase [Bacilli bacterium]MDD3421931.1 dTMP kinase [Bacilli bacterium]